MRSKIKPMKKVAKMLRAHRPLLLNWFRAKNMIALGCVEGFNNKAKVVTKRSYGFRTYDGMKISLYHALGDPPEVFRVSHVVGYMKGKSAIYIARKGALLGKRLFCLNRWCRRSNGSGIYP